jgi:hypothetical protein
VARRIISPVPFFNVRESAGAGQGQRKKGAQKNGETAATVRITPFRKRLHLPCQSLCKRLHCFLIIGTMSIDQADPPFKRQTQSIVNKQIF